MVGDTQVLGTMVHNWLLNHGVRLEYEEMNSVYEAYKMFITHFDHVPSELFITVHFHIIQYSIKYILMVLKLVPAYFGQCSPFSGE